MGLRIGFNLFPYNLGENGGAEFYTRNLILSLPSVFDQDQDRIVLFGNARMLAAYPQNNKCFELVPARYEMRSRLIRVLAEQTILPVLCREHYIDCIVSNYVVPIFAPCPKVVIVHDLRHKAYPELLERSKLLYWRALIPASIRASRSVATVSQFSASEINTFYPEASGKIFITVEGVRPSLQICPSPYLVDDPESPFLLCVATFGKHKNIDTLIRAFKALLPDYPNLRLVLVGATRTSDAGAYKESLVELCACLEITSNVEFAGHVSDEQLADLYCRARAFILPSLHEGFGLPIIEAQNLGCPVIYSNAGSLPEIAGEGGLIFDPHNEQDLVQQLKNLLSNPGLRARLQKLGYENVKRFSWQEAARGLLKAVEHAASDK